MLGRADTKAESKLGELLKLSVKEIMLTWTKVERMGMVKSYLVQDAV